jgi:hypothetical protein
LRRKYVPVGIVDEDGDTADDTAGEGVGAARAGVVILVSTAGRLGAAPQSGRFPRSLPNEPLPPLPAIQYKISKGQVRMFIQIKSRITYHKSHELVAHNHGDQREEQRHLARKSYGLVQLAL